MGVAGITDDGSRHGLFSTNGVYDDDDCVDFDRFADGGGRVYDDNDCDHFTDF